MTGRRSRIALAGLLFLVGMIGCPKGAGIDAEQCADLATKSGALALAIADLATTDEEELDLVARSVAIAELAVALGCPLVIDLIDDQAAEDRPRTTEPPDRSEGSDGAAIVAPGRAA
jgi:hypothetical protein